MPIGKITSSGRGKTAIAVALAAAVASGWQGYKTATATPPAVVLTTNSLIKPWEGLQLTSHWDRYAKIWDICWGETQINGKPVGPGMSFTRKQCDDMLDRRLYEDYYLPLVKRMPEYTKLPLSLQATLLSGAYNFGVGAQLGSTQVRLAKAGRYREACEAQTAWNKAGGVVVRGLVNRREMGDAQRIGEAELCVSGL